MLNILIAIHSVALLNLFYHHIRFTTLHFSYICISIYSFGLIRIFAQVLPSVSVKETRPLLAASTSATPKVLLNYCEPKDSKKPKQKKSSVKSIKYLSGESFHTIYSWELWKIVMVKIYEFEMYITRKSI